MDYLIRAFAARALMPLPLGLVLGILGVGLWVRGRFDTTIAPGARLSAAGLYRLVEGVRIATAQPWSTLVLSGYGGSDPRSNADVYRDVAVSLGFAAERTLL